MLIIGQLFLIAGAVFCLVAGLGTLRFGDLYARMHAATKAGAFGVSLMLVGLNFLDPSVRLAVMSVLIVLFFYLTAPIAAHMIGRAAFLMGIQPHRKTQPIEYQPEQLAEADPAQAQGGTAPDSAAKS